MNTAAWLELTNSQLRLFGAVRLHPSAWRHSGLFVRRNGNELNPRHLCDAVLFPLVPVQRNQPGIAVPSPRHDFALRRGLSETFAHKEVPDRIQPAVFESNLARRRRRIRRQRIDHVSNQCGPAPAFRERPIMLVMQLKAICMPPDCRPGRIEGSCAG